MDSYKVTDSEAGKLTVYRDSVVTFAATAADGYKIGVWQLNGAKQDSAKFGAENFGDASRAAVEDMIADISGALESAK